ncbi:unnamed protein product [Cercopithifilaria johnstoni]|uniref:Uncharacterized protein n=1 Tax=Cercopithifilaria johnstoni TaxID=2874296 RepID=A0A8J2MII1_9BILA|nr:unnamed protein product [Cercopithifilaria johnstoni]
MQEKQSENYKINKTLNNHLGEAEVSPEETDKNISDIAMPEMKRLALDINLPQSGSDPLLPNKVNKTSWAIVGGVVCGAVVIACLVGAVAIFINRRRQKRQAV